MKRPRKQDSEIRRKSEERNSKSETNLNYQMNDIQNKMMKLFLSSSPLLFQFAAAELNAVEGIHRTISSINA